jgi:outer membrane protein assembly factor BamB
VRFASTYDGQNVCAGITSLRWTGSEFEFTGAVACVDAATGTLKWRTGLEGAPSADLVVADGILLQLHGTKYPLRVWNRYLAAFRASDGAVLWTAPLGTRITEEESSAPAVAENIVYIVTNETRLMALELATGERKWVMASSSEVPFESSPVLVGETLFTSGSNLEEGGVVRVDLQSGRQRFIRIDDVIDQSPFISNGSLFLTTKNGSVYRIR